MDLLKFQKIEYKEFYIKSLYSLLKQRGEHSISHKSLPNYVEHKKFVKNHQYRTWYLIFQNENLIGSLYITKDNCIGLFLIKWKKNLVEKIFNWILKRYTPRPAIKSLVTDFFFINVSPNNLKLIKILNKLNFEKIQLTFKI